LHKNAEMMVKMASLLVTMTLQDNCATHRRNRLSVHWTYGWVTGQYQINEEV